VEITVIVSKIGIAEWQEAGRRRQASGENTRNDFARTMERMNPGFLLPCTAASSSLDSLLLGAGPCQYRLVQDDYLLNQFDWSHEGQRKSAFKTAEHTGRFSQQVITYCSFKLVLQLASWRQIFYKARTK
jgi:hypothetical protein